MLRKVLSEFLRGGTAIESLRIKPCLSEDIARTHDCILCIWAGLTFEAQGLFEIESNHRRLCVFQQEVAQGADRNLSGNRQSLGFTELGMPLVYFFFGGSDQAVDEVIRLHTETFAS